MASKTRQPRWEPDELKTVRVLLQLGRSYELIAVALRLRPEGDLGRSPGSIRHKARSQGWTGREDREVVTVRNGVVKVRVVSGRARPVLTP